MEEVVVVIGVSLEVVSEACGRVQVHQLAVRDVALNEALVPTRSQFGQCDYRKQGENGFRRQRQLYGGVEVEGEKARREKLDSPSRGTYMGTLGIVRASDAMFSISFMSSSSASQ